MVTIRDVAKLANVSPTTVSLVIGGRAASYGIPERTCNRVLAAMNELNYRPNISARKLRSAAAPLPVIAFFWPLGDRMPILSMFIEEFQSELQSQNFECEFIIQTYQIDQLDKSLSHLSSNEYHAAIIGGASMKDVDCLDAIHVNMPIVVINRDSKTHSSVQANNLQMAQAAADLLLKRKTRDIGIICMRRSYVATNFRIKTLMHICREHGCDIAEQFIVQGPNTRKGGAECVEELARRSSLPSSILVETSTMAIGALYQFHKLNVRVPDDVAVLAFNMGNEDTPQYNTPSLTIVSMPSRDIAKTAINIIINSLRDTERVPMHVSYDGRVIYGESFPR